MSGFKLIAIVPLKDCNTKFRKNLEIGLPYTFYNCYDIILNEEKSEIISITIENDNCTPDNFYSLTNGINLNFSAVVGKNGTGKSTIIELLYYFIYTMGIKKESINSVLNDLEKEEKQIAEDYHYLINFIDIESKLSIKEKLNEFDINFLENNNLDIDSFCFELNQKYRFFNAKKRLESRNDIHKFIKNELFNKATKISFLIEKEKKVIEPAFTTGLNLSVIYETDSIIKELKLYNGEMCLIEHNVESKTEFKEFDLEDFFYSISLNYSHHGLNSKILGNWITKLFHKNDAYTTPVVINPMRNDGNFDINHEIRLSKERLMSNVVFDLINKKENLLLGKYGISKFIFTPKILSPPFPLEFTNEFINSLHSGYIFKNILNIYKLDDNIDYWDFAISYLEKKISKIDENYGAVIHLNENVFDYDTELKNFILKDKSHVTKKIRQVVNFLKATNEKKNREFWKMEKNSVRIELTPERMLEWLNLHNIDSKNTKPSEIIEFALPGFFNIDFELKDKKNEKFEFGKLSSGEQQMIFNINSILYHLYNIQSVHIPYEIVSADNPRVYEIERVKYKNINIILDEVELYYHPEMQRLLVKNIIDSFENIKNKGDLGIQSINVCFLTHSPFILSDIPTQNVMHLKEKSSTNTFQNQLTFGANIHELLTNSFFMESTAGEYSLTKIDEIIKFYYSVLQSNKIERINLKEEYLEKKEYFHFIVDNIGEDIVRSILENHLEYLEETLPST